MITVKNLNKSFGKRPVLRGVNVEFKQNQVVAVIGPNASGKTTLIKCLLGLVIPDDGDILFNGEPITPTGEYRKHIGYMPQIGHYPDHMKVRDLFTMMDDIRGFRDGLNTKSEIQNPITHDMDLNLKFKLNDIADKAMHTLSGGTKQKVGAALTFRYDPSVVILDEPTAGLDPLSSEILKEKIREEHAKGKLILITSHVLSDLDDLATHVLYLQDGEIRFFKPVDDLKIETGEEKLARILAQIMQDEGKKVEFSKNGHLKIHPITSF
jgi:Cu-processing system ATP-binding protein